MQPSIYPTSHSLSSFVLTVLEKAHIGPLVKHIQVRLHVDDRHCLGRINSAEDRPGRGPDTKHVEVIAAVVAAGMDPLIHAFVIA